MEQPTGAPADVHAVLETQLALLVRGALLLEQREADAGVLDRSGYLLLRLLSARGPTTCGELAAALGLDASTITRQVGALEVAGLVSRHPGEQDRRCCYVQTTPRGRDRLAAARAQRERRIAGLVGSWTSADQEALGELLSAFNRELAARYLPGEATEGLLTDRSAALLQ